MSIASANVVLADPLRPWIGAEIVVALPGSHGTLRVEVRSRWEPTGQGIAKDKLVGYTFYANGLSCLTESEAAMFVYTMNEAIAWSRLSLLQYRGTLRGA